jgi:hypothetical protein
MITQKFLDKINAENQERRQFALSLKRGMVVRYIGRTDKDLMVKTNDKVKITSAQNVGTDWEQVRVGNGKYTWRVSSYDLTKVI